MLLGLIAAALQPSLPVPPAPPPPIVRTNIIPPAPPQPFIAVPSVPRPAVTIQVRVDLGRERLVDERLRVGLANATINRSRQEALAGDCPILGASLNQTLSLSLRPDYAARDTKERFRLELRISRPVQQGCDSGSRGLSLDQQFLLPPGQSITLTGDAGLKVELRRE